VLQRLRKQVPFHVVHAEHGLPGAEGEPFGITDANQQGADEPGGVRHRHDVDVA